MRVFLCLISGGVHPKDAKGVVAIADGELPGSTTCVYLV